MGTPILLIIYLIYPCDCFIVHSLFSPTFPKPPHGVIFLLHLEWVGLLVSSSLSFFCLKMSLFNIYFWDILIGYKFFSQPFKAIISLSSGFIFFFCCEDSYELYYFVCNLSLRLFHFVLVLAVLKLNALVCLCLFCFQFIILLNLWLVFIFEKLSSHHLFKCWLCPIFSSSLFGTLITCISDCLTLIYVFYTVFSIFHSFFSPSFSLYIFLWSVF